MALKTYELFVGSNVKTGSLETEKLIEITLGYFDEATLNTNLTELHKDGNKRGTSVIVKGDLLILDKYIREVKKVLHLSEIAYHQINKLKKQ